MKPAILVVDDERELCTAVAEHLEEAGFEVVQAYSAEEGEARASEREFDVALLDVRLPDGSGLKLLKALKRVGGSPEVIIMTGHTAIDDAVAAIRDGALDYLSKPVRLATVETVVRKAIEVRRLRQETVRLREGLRNADRYEEWLGRSEPALRVLERVDQVAPTNSTVLMLGESGTGKELMARTIHRRSARSPSPFTVVDCGALPESLLESELFGHEKGAFTGALERRRGLIEVADGGTLFVDEITEMPVSCQTRLLRVLETGEFRRVGSERVLVADVRVIVATRRDIVTEVRAGKFRDDLYYRLNVFSIALPPLRERPEDIPLIAERYLERRKRGSALSPETLSALLHYPWPGNVRELLNTLERALITCGNGVIRPEHLGLPLSPTPMSTVNGLASLEQVEREHLHRVLEAVRGDKHRAAGILGISPRHVYRLIEKYGNCPLRHE